MATMQEYLEEMARRQALGWTPGVPSRFTAPVATSWNLPTTARTTMRKAVPKANLGDIAAASADPVRKQGVGRPRLTPEEIQRTASRQGMGTVGKTVKAIAPFAKVAGPVGLVAELLRSEPAVASTEVPPGGYFFERQAYPSMAVEEGYPNVSTLPSFDVTPDAGGAIGGIPGVQPMEKYGPSGYEGESIPPSGYRQVAPDTVIAASDFDIGPTSMAMVGTNAFGIPDRTYAPTMQGVDYSQALADIGMGTVPTVTRTSLPGRTPQAGYDKGPGDVHGGFIDILGSDVPFLDDTQWGDLINLDPTKREGYMDKQKIIEEMVTLGLMNADQANQAKQWAWQTDTDTTFAQKMAQMLGTTLGGWIQLFDEETLDEGMKAWIANVKGTSQQADALVPGTIELIEEMTKGNIKPSELEALINLDPGTVNSADIAEIISQVDTFADLADVDVQTQVDTFKDFDAIAAQTAARQAQLDADKAAAQAQRDAARAEQQAAAAAARASKQMANRKAAQRKAMLAKQKLAAKNKLAAQKAAAAQARAAVQAQAAAQAQAQSAANAAIERVAKANALMGSKAYQESGLDGLTAAQRDIVAAAQVDTFAGISGMGAGFMGSNIGQEDGGGYTGGDFSSGAGWE